MKRLDSPDKKLKIAHIAGTNGKGSTAAYITRILIAAGMRVGTFISPQVYSFYDQFLIDGVPILKNVFDPYISLVERACEGMDDAPSPFEIQTAAALCAFSAEGCEYAVLECGLGGRDDATNAIERKEVAVITSVSLEHTKELGSTVTEICRAKSGIVKGCPLVLSAYNGKDALNFFKPFNPVIAGADIKAEEVDLSSPCQKFSYRGKTYALNMLGEAQPYNAACAMEACKILGVDEKYFEEGLSSARLGGRSEIIERGGVTYILDGAHNPAAISQFAGVMRLFGGEAELAFGCLSDKDVGAAARILSPLFKRAYLFSPASPRAMDINKIESAFRGAVAYEIKENVSEALNAAASPVVAVCGSFTVLKEAREWIGKRR